VLERRFNPKGVIRPCDGNEDIPLINDLTSQNTVKEARGNKRGLPDEKEGGSGDVFSQRIYLFVTDEECFQVKGPQTTPQLTLAQGPDHDGYEGN
jgi:hypothetical protein